MDADLKGLFPPRRQWARFRSKRKDRLAEDAHAVNGNALRRAVHNLMRKNPGLPWARRLRERASEIRFRALDGPNTEFAPPRVTGDLKDPDTHEYRPISLYGTNDKILQKLTARYLNDRLDFCFSSSSLAYRRRREPAINRDTALRLITEFRRRHSRVFVAEADLRNFMDCVDHQLARESLHAVIRQGKALSPDLEIDPRAIQIHDAYLASYDFTRDVLGRGLEMLMERDAKAVFTRPEDVLRKMRKDGELGGIGIPQGGAISCFITNVMLHDVDMAVERLTIPGGCEILYLRYCDDMLILSSDRAACQEAMTAYQRAVGCKMLPVHEPVDVFQRDGKPKPGYSNLRSKKPYLWSRPGDSGIPWIQFVGFEIRHDGLVRIREKSLEKQRRKMSDEADKLIGAINPGRKTKDGIPVYAPGLRMDSRQILHCLEMKLIAMSVGRRTFGQPLPSCGDDIMPMCWANGYQALWQAPYDPSQLKELDRHRDRQIRRVRSLLNPLAERQGSSQGSDDRKKGRLYHGAPFSYHGQFARSQKG